MSGSKSRNKGKRGEREAAKLLTSLGYPARRGSQFSGQGSDSADIVFLDPLTQSHLRVEVKFGMNDVHFPCFEVERWMNKLRRELHGPQEALILWRKTRKPWVAVLTVNDMLVATPHIENAVKYLLTR